MTQEIGRRLVNGVWVTNVADETPNGGSTPENVPTLQYLEWTPVAAATQTASFPAGTQVIAAWLVTDIAWDEGFPNGVMNIGTSDTSPDAWGSGIDVSTAGQIYTVADLQGGTDPAGIDKGFPFTSDDACIFPAGGDLVGTITPGAATTGRTRLYFLACIPTLWVP